MSEPLRILVTGGASCSAHHLAPLLPADASVTYTDVGGSAPAGHELVPLDLTRAEDTDRLVASVRPQRIVHLAGVAGPDADICWAVNLGGTRHLLRAAAHTGDVPLLLLVSSSAIYGKGRHPGRPLAEKAQPRPLGAYGASKGSAESLARAFHARGEVALIVARPFNLVGPGLRAGLAPADFLNRVLALGRSEGAGVIETGNLDPRRDFVDVRDAARAYALLLARPDLAGRTFNVASGKPVRIGDILDILLRITGVDARVVTPEARRRAGDLALQVGDASAIRSAVGWSPAIGLETSLQDMVAAAGA